MDLDPVCWNGRCKRHLTNKGDKGNQAFRQMLAQRLDARGGPSNAQGGISDPRKSPSNVAVVHRKVGDRFTI